MLQMCMDQNFFLYGMIAAGILGVWCLFWSSRFYHTAVKDMKRREAPRGKWTLELLDTVERRGTAIKDPEAFLRSRLQEGKILSQRAGSLLGGVNLAVSLCGVCLLLGIWGIYLLQYEQYVLYQYLLLSGSIISLLLLARYTLNFSDKRQRLLEGWKDYLGNREAPAEPAGPGTGHGFRSGEREDQPSETFGAGGSHHPGGRKDPGKGRRKKQVCRTHESGGRKAHEGGDPGIFDLIPVERCVMAGKRPAGLCRITQRR